MLKEKMKAKGSDGKMPKPSEKSGHWDGGGGLGNKGEHWEGTGKHCRGEAAKRGFGKS